MSYCGPVLRRELTAANDLALHGHISFNLCGTFFSSTSMNRKCSFYKLNSFPYLNFLVAAPFAHSRFTRRFNATDFLVRLSGKRLMLVGDSMNRNQFESILCLLREGLPDKSRMFETHGYRITKGRGYYVFKFMVHKCDTFSYFICLAKIDGSEQLKYKF